MAQLFVLYPDTSTPTRKGETDCPTGDSCRRHHTLAGGLSVFQMLIAEQLSSPKGSMVELSQQGSKNHEEKYRENMPTFKRLTIGLSVLCFPLNHFCMQS
ncbi:hypothetical protein EMPG_11829 [Blastomyces silverae]|uniref:Uncharacterized protein n=1 Tax=Blastomyces silverae TaxID=2060906 RepID=A0A0H1BQ92_9EURO|nr:hypothetical protein EMPG_11829 [Blastomyces silverae]